MKNIVNFYNYLPRKEAISMCEILKKLKGKNAIELLNDYDISIEKLPIDIPQLLEKIGISTYEQDFSELEDETNCEHGYILGAAISKDEKLGIFFKKNESLNRVMYIVAHELGHCCVHTDTLKIEHIEFKTSVENENEHEEEANRFARELLIPESSLRKQHSKFLIPSLNALSKIYRVSTKVMAERLDELNLSYFKDAVVNEE